MSTIGAELSVKINKGGRKMIKPETIESIEAYAKTGRPTGGFLYAVLSNNLCESFDRADTENRAALHEIIRYIYHNIPADSWGSTEKVEAWLKAKREEFVPMKNYPDPDER